MSDEVKQFGISDILAIIQFLRTNPEVIQVLKEIIALVKSLMDQTQNGVVKA